MDYLTMHLAGKVLHDPARRLRMMVASGFGGLCGTIITLHPLLSRGILATILALLATVISTWIAWGRENLAAFLRRLIVMWGTGSLLGGIMTFFLSLGTPVVTKNETPFYTVFLLVMVLSSIVVRLFRSGRRKQSTEVVVRAAEHTVRFRALCDSGSFLQEPISGMPVILASEGVLGEIGKELNSQEPTLAIRLIPAEGIGGSCLLVGFLPDVVEVGGRQVKAVVAMDRGRRTYGGFDGIVPAALFGNSEKGKNTNIMEKGEANADRSIGAGGNQRFQNNGGKADAGVLRRRGSVLHQWGGGSAATTERGGGISHSQPL